MLDDRLVSHTPLAATILCLGAITPLLPTLRFHTSIAVTVTGATARRFNCSRSRDVSGALSSSFTSQRPLS
jgi:hypothetical protein